MSNNERWSASTATKEPGASSIGPTAAVDETEVRIQAESPTGNDTGCRVCGAEVSLINITVDGNVLVMESCDRCDARRWHIAGEPISLDRVLDEVGERDARRR